MKAPKVVAHRGYAARFPENTLEALQAAVDCGARNVEVDVQLTSDHIAVLLHDDDLLRTSGVAGAVMDLTWDAVGDYTVGETQRLGDKFKHVRVPSVADLAMWLQRHPNVRAFVEIKEESLARFGTDWMVRRVVESLEPVLEQCVIISYDAPALAEARRFAGTPIGWVIRNWDAADHTRADQLKPEYLICNYKKIEGDLWAGSWRWILYEIPDADVAIEWAARGIEFVETMAVGELLADPRLA